MKSKQLKVTKADGSVEEYLHTKVIGTIGNVLAAVHQTDIFVAEHLAEAVTFYLYNSRHRNIVSSSEIFSVIKVVLTSTTHSKAAVALDQYHYNRKLKRSRTEVVSIDIRDLSDAERLCTERLIDQRSRWDKSIIVADVISKHNFSRHTARIVASMVEEKIFNMGITLVPTSLIKQLVLGDTAIVVRADQQLQMV